VTSVHGKGKSEVIQPFYPWRKSPRYLLNRRFRSRSVGCAEGKNYCCWRKLKHDTLVQFTWLYGLRCPRFYKDRILFIFVIYSRSHALIFSFITPSSPFFASFCSCFICSPYFLIFPFIFFLASPTVCNFPFFYLFFVIPINYCTLILLPVSAKSCDLHNYALRP